MSSENADVQKVFDFLSANVEADPYSDDGLFAKRIEAFPVGMRAMAATHWLSISLAMDDIGWHFLNFGEAGLVKQTEAGLIELDLPDLAELFAEAHRLVKPVVDTIDADGSLDGSDFYELLQSHGIEKRLDQISAIFAEKLPLGDICPIWQQYIEQHPQKVFGQHDG